MQSLNVSTLCRFDRNRRQAEVVEELRRLLPRLERTSAETRIFPFGLPALDAYLPHGGLVSGALHEVAPATDGDTPAAFGFTAALLSRMPQVGPILIVLASRQLARCGQLHGHGLRSLGLDPVRVILVETRDEKSALWAMEEALRSRVPAVVVGALGAKLDLKTSQRLNFAAGASEIPLVLLRPAGVMESSATATRWRIGAAMAARNRFGLMTRWRWQVKLERCRNGRPGEWLVEFDHVANCFSLAATLANPAHPRDPDAQFIMRAS
jgi:protein ImuA